jgi:adenylate kinase family enzyme
LHLPAYSFVRFSIRLRRTELHHCNGPYGVIACAINSEVKRICIIGTSGAGKTTLGKAVAQRLNLPFVDSDSFYWQAGWQPASQAVLQERVLAATLGEAWVFEGNYLSLRQFVWQRADTLIWLDFSLPVVLGRVCWRNTRRTIGREQLWNGNRMNWRRAWSGVQHTRSTYQGKRANYPQSIAEFPHLQVVHLRSPRQAKQWLLSV